MVRKFRRTRRKLGGDVLADAKKYKNAINNWHKIDEEEKKENKKRSKKYELSDNDDTWVRRLGLTRTEWGDENGKFAKYNRITKDRTIIPGMLSHPRDFSFYKKYKDIIPGLAWKYDGKKKLQDEFGERREKRPGRWYIQDLEEIVKDMEQSKQLSDFSRQWFADNPTVAKWLEENNKAGGRKKSRRKSRRRKKSTKKKRRRRKKRSRRRRK